MGKKNYIAYHVHSDFSFLDSCTDFKEYINKATEYKMKAIAFTEHGNIYNWVEKKMFCDQVGIKYIHGAEFYLTKSTKEKIRDNYHTILLAKNYEGVLEINNLISKSNEKENFYYTNRISFEDFFNISNNVIKISACLASPLNHKNEINPDIFDKLLKSYDFYEIQYHNIPEQKEYNIELYSYSKKYNKPLIAGTDTHSLNKYKAECRNLYLTANHKSYGNEDSFDLTFKSYDELCDLFNKQNCFSKDIWQKAIDNTNILYDLVEDFELDMSFKYPVLYENDDKMYEQTLEKKFKEKIENNIIKSDQIEKFKNALHEETRVFEKVGMKGFMLFMSELITWFLEHDIPTGFARGICNGSRVAYVLYIIELNPEDWNTIFSRFCNEDRKEIGDIDIDLDTSDRPRVHEYIINRFGSEKVAFIITYQTLATRNTIDEICRGLFKKWEQNHDKKEADLTPYRVPNREKIKKEYDDDPVATKEKYPEIFYYFDGLLNTRKGKGQHAGGIVVSPISLNDHYGLCKNEDGLNMIEIDMDNIHEINLVKYDLLGLVNIAIIKDIYKMINKPYPRSYEIDWYDENVWNSITKSSVGIFQFESPFAFQSLCKFKPKSLFEMAHVTAAIRPSGASYRDDLLNRKSHKNPSILIDNLLKKNNGFLIYQEDVIAFLQHICGLSGSEADNVRRAIGRKDKDRLQKALPSILKGYCLKSKKPQLEAEKEAMEFLKIIEDASSYMFGYNHAIAYCMISYLCAYLRYYYPIEFVTSFLNHANKESDISNGSRLAAELCIKIVAPVFGISKDVYCYDKKNNTIAKGLASVKFLNKKVSLELYELSRSHYDTFLDVLMDLDKKTSMKSRQLNILIELDFFRDLGNINELLYVVEIFDFFKNGTITTLSKNKLNQMVEIFGDKFYDILNKYATDKGKSGNILKSYRIADCMGLLKELQAELFAKGIYDYTFRQKIKAQEDYLGYVDLKTGKKEDTRKLIILDVRALSDNKKIWVYSIRTQALGSGKRSRVSIKPGVYNKNPVHKYNIIDVKDLHKNKSGYWYLTKYELVE